MTGISHRLHHPRHIGRKGLRVSHKGREDVLLPEELIESITGLPVEKIIFRNQSSGRSSPGA